MQLLAPLVAGLGLFFCGVHFLSQNLTPLIGRRFRGLLTRLVRTRLLAGVAGIAAGVLTQSTNAVTFVVIGLVSGGIVEKKRAILIPTWAHVGTAVLVVLVAINFKVAASYVIGVAGFAVYYGLERSERARNVVGVLLGLGLIFIGLDALKAGTLPVRDALLSSGILTEAATSPVWLLLLGAGLTVICQSSTVVGAITVAASAVGILDFQSAVWLVFGSNLGSGVNHVLVARTMQGEAAQIALIQVVQKLAGFAVLAAVVVTNRATGTPIFFGLERLLQHDAGRIAAVFAAYQIAGSTFCTIFLAPITRCLERIAPPSALQELSRPAYLVGEALVEPTFAIELVGREEQRVLQRLPLMLDEMRADAGGEIRPARLIGDASRAVTKAMAAYSDDILGTGLSKTDRERVVRAQHRIANLSSLFDGLMEFVVACREARAAPASALVADQMIESLHSLLQSLVDAGVSGDGGDLNFLLQLLGHRDEIMERIRRRVMNDDPDMPASAHAALFNATMLFERIVWLARQNALLLMSERGPGLPQAAGA